MYIEYIDKMEDKSLILKTESMSNKMDYIEKQMKQLATVNSKLHDDNVKMREQMNQLITVVKNQETMNNILKKSIVEMKRDYDLKALDDKIINEDRADVIKNWHADRGKY